MAETWVPFDLVDPFALVGPFALAGPFALVDPFDPVVPFDQARKIIKKALDFDVRVILSFRSPFSTLRFSLKFLSFLLNKICSKD